MILSAGKEDKVKSAVNYIRHALIGVFFLIIVLFVFPVISRLVGLSYPEYAAPGVIFDTISEITNRIFNTNLYHDLPLHSLLVSLISREYRFCDGRLCSLIYFFLPCLLWTSLLFKMYLLQVQ